jgi:hypothetical protein
MNGVNIVCQNAYVPMLFIIYHDCKEKNEVANGKIISIFSGTPIKNDSNAKIRMMQRSVLVLAIKISNIIFNNGICLGIPFYRE